MSKTKLLLTTALLAALIAPVTVNNAKADIIYTLGESNIVSPDVPGPGPYGFVDLHRVDDTHVDFTFFGNSVAGFNYTFGEMAVNLALTGFTDLATQVTVSAMLNFTTLPGVSHPVPTFAASIDPNGGQAQMDGFGNFNIHEIPSPDGASAALVTAKFELTRTVGSWLTEAGVLTATGNGHGNVVSDHVFVNALAGGPTGFTNDTSSITCAPADCPVINPLAAVPEPASFLLFGTSAMGLAWARRNGRKISGR